MDDVTRATELIARSHAVHLKDFSDFQVAFDNYYTTNSPENKALSERIYAAAEKQGFITKKTTPQLYCERCKMFLPDRFVKGACPKCGAEGQYGQLTAGAAADVVVWTGDPLEPLSRPTAIFIDGKEQPLTSRQTELRDRYLNGGEGVRPPAYPQ